MLSFYLKTCPYEKGNLELDAKQGRDGIFLDFLYLSKDIIISDIHREKNIYIKSWCGVL